MSYIANSATSILKSTEFGEIRGQNISHYIRGRTILKVALYKNSDAIFSHYIRGRIVLKVALFSRLYGMPTAPSVPRIIEMSLLRIIK